MGKLSNADLRKVLDSIAILNSAVDPGSLCERTLGCALSLIPNSTMTAFDGLDPEGKYDGSLWYSPPETVPLERVELLANLVHEHPYCQDFFATRTSKSIGSVIGYPYQSFTGQHFLMSSTGCLKAKVKSLVYLSWPRGLS